MTRSLPMLLASLCLSPPVLAADVVLGAVVGSDFPTDHIWTGAQLAVHANHEEGIALSARFEPGYAPMDGNPLFFGEVGAHWVVPTDPEQRVTLRTGLTARVGVPVVTYPLPLRFGPVGKSRPGVVPALLWSVEFAWDRKVDTAFGLRAGATSTLGAHQCSVGEPDDNCIVWLPGFNASFYGRIFFDNHLALEFMLGHQVQLSVGYRF